MTGGLETRNPRFLTSVPACSITYAALKQGLHKTAKASPSPSSRAGVRSGCGFALEELGPGRVCVLCPLGRPGQAAWLGRAETIRRLAIYEATVKGAQMRGREVLQLHGAYTHACLARVTRAICHDGC